MQSNVCGRGLGLRRRLKYSLHCDAESPYGSICGLLSYISGEPFFYLYLLTEYYHKTKLRRPDTHKQQ